MEQFKSWKTTLTAIISAIALILAQFGIIELTNEQQIAIGTIALVIIGFFAKDAGKTDSHTETLTIEKEVSSEQS